MRSLMGSIGLWNQIYPDWQVPNNPSMTNFTPKLNFFYYQLVILISFSLSQSDPVKWLLMYTNKASLDNNNDVFHRWGISYVKDTFYFR